LIRYIVWYQVIESNRTSKPHLSSSQFLVSLAIFGVAMIASVVTIIRHFAKAP
jgi:hypothetical protein